ncbi:GNAT family N-acetyltransferase [Hyunsoonleella pacifica]|uniref:N-acetyltransferase n=1 Tax=Hyunsoonleella pacifica TaxID=1080224 RepID=A0A4Q9FS38_9FLAO|nr:GNAT family N-acetyltransferase [Hyunsoonleella pacifica]TBN18874.1 N-acetyltransferase [Hyunsoonleella pacifica]GGD05522.1 acetyltransferase [Hyunsoonleella pacifica]
MKTLTGKHINLRALEPEDLDFVFEIENDETIWHLGNTQTPFSRYVIKQYLENALKDIFEAKQLRLVVESKKREALGLIDLFDFDFKNKRAGVGIIVKDEANRAKGYGNEALKLLINYSFTHLGLHQLYCNISEENKASIQLFTKHGFEKIGLKKDWNYNGGNYNNEFLFQLIKS